MIGCKKNGAVKEIVKEFCNNCGKIVQVRFCEKKEDIFIKKHCVLLWMSFCRAPSMALSGCFLIRKFAGDNQRRKPNE